MAQARKDSVWIQTSNGCKVHNPHPVKNETIVWTGACAGGYANGKGTLQWLKSGKPNQQYEGEMKRGIPNGEGRYIYVESGTIRQGTFKNGDLTGMGKIIQKYDKSDAVGYMYIGDFRNNNPSGKGKEIEFTVKGDTILLYTGEFLDGQKNGYGERIMGTNRYLGEWKKGKREGAGRSYLDSTLVYDGQWLADKYHGSGKRTYLDGSSYFGEFKESKRHGIGKQRWKDGSMYIGEFSNDVYAGYGFVVKNGKLYACGNWADGRLASEVDFKRMKEVLTARHKNDLAKFGISLK